jgi:basic amino acid/polyamine antiporter, APA family
MSSGSGDGSVQNAGGIARESSPDPRSSTARLGVWDTVSIIVGIVIGAGIYETVPFILQNVASPTLGIGVWVLGGVLSLIGALCYAELATTYPRSGGDYVYLTRAFAPSVGFLFGWAQLTVILTGSIGMMAYVFADYAVVLFGMTKSATYALAFVAIAVITAVNVAGAFSGKHLQNVLTGLKVVGLAAILIAGFLFGGSAAPAAAPRGSGGSFGLAMILVLYTYGGWNDAAFVAAEVREPRRNIPRALLFGTLAITVIYVLVNAAYLAALGFDGARQSRAIAADVLSLPLGAAGAKAMSAVVMISALGAVNGLIYTGARIYSSMGDDHPLFRRLSQWHPRFGTPVASLLAQSTVALLLISIVGTERGQRAVDALLVTLGFAAASWDGHGGFDTLLRCTAPVFWTFFFLTGVSLFVLRRKDRDRERVFRVPLYPVLPLVFCATALYMLYSATDYAGRLTIVGLIPLAFGIAVYLLSPSKRASALDAPTRA